MTSPGRTVLSVRGDARRTVVPDLARLHGHLRSAPAARPEALRDVAAAQERLLADLAERGGVPLTVETERAPLTWSSYGVTTEEGHEPDPATGHYRNNGEFTASVLVLLTVRALDTLDALGALLARHERLQLEHVQWGADQDNPAWPEVRAAAIRAAVRKGRDCASALGGTLHSVEHVADAGLLPGTEAGPYGGGWAEQVAVARSAGRDAPSLDPVPQVLTATVEARFLAVGVTLDGL